MLPTISAAALPAPTRRRSQFWEDKLGPAETQEVVFLQAGNSDLFIEDETGRFDLGTEDRLSRTNVIQDPIGGDTGNSLEVDHD